MRKILLLFLFTSLVFSQGKTSTLEDKIYNSIDAFVANPTEENLQRLEKAEKSFHPKSTSEILAVTILNCNKAYYQNQFGQTQKAIKSYEKAWQLFQENKLSNYDITESCLQPLGNLYTVTGDYENAENTIKQYFYIANLTQNSLQKYAAILNLSNVYQNTGRIVEAIELLEKTLQTEKLTNVQKGILFNNLGNNYFLSTETLFVINGNPYLKGENAYKKSIAFLHTEKNQAEPLLNAYRNLAKRYAVIQEYDSARSYMKKAGEQLVSLPDIEPRKKAQFFYDEAFLLFRQGRLSEAGKKNSEIFEELIPGFSSKKSILPAKNSLYPETVLLDALDLQSELFLAQNQPKRALESYQLAFHVETLFDPLLWYENSKIIAKLRNRKRTEKCLSVYYSFSQKEPKASYGETAFLLAEKTKSAVLKQSLLASGKQSKEENLIVQQLQNWNTIILKEQQKSEKADITKINEAIKKQNELMLLLKSKKSKKNNESTEWSIADLYSRLEKEKVIMVEYFQGWEWMYVFTIENKNIRLERFNISDTAVPKLVQFIDFFNDSNAISNDPSTYNHFGHVAYNVLKLPKITAYKNLVIIPDGILNFLPFEALITKESATTDFSGMHYLLRDFKIGYSNSADFYLNAIPFQHKKESVLGVFPIFGNTSSELAFSKKELENLKAGFNGKYLEGEKATFGNFKKNAAGFSILHLSTHASSGDIFKPAGIRFYDQEIVYSELYNLDIHPNLVVLSACETGLGKLYKAEGAMSVARGFQFAGAQNLLFSLWKVNDYTTSVFMQKFYANVKDGHSYFDASHQAKIDFLADESIPNTKKSPYYWSAFAYYGTLEKKDSVHYFMWISLLAGLIGLLLLWKWSQKNKKRTL